MSLESSFVEATGSARGVAVIFSANPIHDTGGEQRSAQMALELLARDWCVGFVSHGEVTETVDLGLRFPYPRLVQTSLGDFLSALPSRAFTETLDRHRLLIVTQVPVGEWLPVIRRVRRDGGVSVYDCIDRWDSELGYGWYRSRTERRVARASDILVASAPTLARHLEKMTGRPARLLPNAFNSKIFRVGAGARRPSDFPEGEAVALYVGSLWGGWMDWALVSQAAEALPYVRFAFVGDHRGEGGPLPSNCHFLGLKAQSDLPGYLSHARAGFLPWRSDGVAQATSPLKVYEYLAMGLPVVTPALESLRGLPGVVPASSPDAFIAAVETVVREGVDGSTHEAMSAFAAKNSWTNRVDDLIRWAEDTPSRPEERGIVAWLRRFGV